MPRKSSVENDPDHRDQDDYAEPSHIHEQHTLLLRPTAFSAPDEVRIIESIEPRLLHIVNAQHHDTRDEHRRNEREIRGDDQLDTHRSPSGNVSGQFLTIGESPEGQDRLACHQGVGACTAWLLDERPRRAIVGPMETSPRWKWGERAPTGVGLLHARLRASGHGQSPRGRHQ